MLEDCPFGLLWLIKSHQGALKAITFHTFTAPARRAKEAAALLGCPLGAVVKSLVFQGESSDSPMLALVSGKNRAESSALSRHFNEQVRQADPQAVLLHTGFPAGAGRLLV
jgi:prolyl-tRNA editing enzyme YbaK/EbsC (Cys-tRNA(Pro) deacylase)